MAKRNEGNFLVSIGSVELGFFETFEGGDLKYSFESRRNGNQKRPDKIPDRGEYDDITLGKTYDPVTDDDLLASSFLTAGDAEVVETLTIQPCNARLEPSGEARVYTAILGEVHPPKADTNSSTPSSWSLTYTVIDMVGSR